MATGFGTALAQSNERVAQVNERIAVSKMMAAGRMRAGAKWFYWIAGLSMVNSAVVIFGGSLHFVVGLGITSVVDALAKRAGNMGSVLDVIINGFVAAGFVLFGYFASKAQRWAFLVGMALYAMDAFLLLGVKDFLSVGFHAYALWAISKGLTASKQIQA